MDPGINFGIAILDTNGNIVNVSSKRYVSKSELVKYITNFGKPIIVASDVCPPPKTVKKISKMLGCKLYYPQVSLSNVEKMKIIKNYKKEIKGYHEKDALAAGIKAFKKHRELFMKIQDATLKFGFDKSFDDILREITEKKVDNIADAIRKLKKGFDEKEETS